MGFPQREYEHLVALADCWRVPVSDIEHFVEIGELPCCVWLQHVLIELGLLHQGADGNVTFEAQKRAFIEGYVGLRPQDCRVLFRDQQIDLRLFVSLCYPGQYLQIVDQSPITIQASEVVVLQKDRQRFEQIYSITTYDTTPTIRKPTSNFTHNQDFTDVLISGEFFRLGSIQAKIVAALYEAYQNGDPWVHGKILLYDAGSCSDSIKSVFKSQPNWRKLIESDRRGYYRLQL